MLCSASMPSLGHSEISTPRSFPGSRPPPRARPCKTLAAAPEREIPVSARLAVLFNLARAGLPHYESYEAEYRLLADSVAQSRGLDVDQLLTDLKESARGIPFSGTSSGQALPHHETAFIGEDICTIRRVKVGGVRATWVYSEFVTHAPFAGVADWVDPRQWSTWGYLFFRRMDLLLSPPAPVNINPPPAGDQHWHGVFHEEVRLVRLVNTLLRCNYWRGTAAAGMTYDLDLSLDGEIDVDRGFLLVTDLGAVRRVQVLKIVSFTQDLWDDVAALVCPFWTDWIRARCRAAPRACRRLRPIRPPSTSSLPAGTP